MAGIKIVDLPALGRDLISTDLLEVSLNGSGSRKITGQEIMNASKLAVGSTSIVSGTVGRLLFQGTGNVLGQSGNLFWDATNNRLGIGTSTPSVPLQSHNSANGTSAGFGGTAFGIRVDNGGTFSVGRSTIYGVDNTFTASYQPLSIEASSLTLQSVTGGNVLIGTTTDGGFKLNVIGTGRFNATLDIRGANQNRIWLNTNAGGTGSGFLVGRSLSNDDAQNFFIYDVAAAASRLQIASTGNLLIGTTTDAGFRLDVNGTARVQGLATLAGTMTASGAIARNQLINGTLVAAANNDTLVGLDIKPTFTNGAFTGVKNLSFRVGNSYGPYTSALSHGVELNTNVGISGSLDLGGDSSVLYLWRSGARGNGAVIGSTYESPNFGHIYFGTPPSKQMILSNATGNLLINTTTDAGFRLDVNGTARFSGALTVAGTGTVFNSTTNTFFHTATGGVQTLDYYNGFIIQNAGQVVFKTAYNGNSRFLRDSVFGSDSANTASAQVEIVSTTKGFLPPRMTNAQRAAIASPAVGLIVYCTDSTEGLYVYKSTGWTFMV